MKRNSVRGFTLVELLVVIGIIVLLMGILMPALGKARLAAGTIACMSNLRQLEAAFQAYADDNKECFPASASSLPEANDWIAYHDLSPTYLHFPQGVLIKYTKNVPDLYRCPADTVDDHPASNSMMIPDEEPYRYSYQVNDLICGPPGSPAGIRQKMILHQSELVLIFCAPTPYSGAYTPDYAPGQTVHMDSIDHGSGPSGRHKFGHDPADITLSPWGPVCFLDGHTELLEHSKWTRRHFDPQFWAVNH